MKKKIHIGRPEITDEKINSYKDFNSLQNTFNLNTNSGMKTGLKSALQSTKFIIGASATALIAGAAIIYSLSGNEPVANVADPELENTQEIVEERKHWVAKPPLDDIDVDYEQFTVSCNSDTVLVTENGSKIFIPQSSFQFHDGSVATGEVKIKYREFHTPQDFFLSGIPMTYDSAGVQYTFESAGMMQIEGEQDGKDLKIIEGNPLKVEMVSSSRDPDFNLYKINDTSGNWEFLGKDKIASREGMGYSSNTHKPMEEHLILHEENAEDITIIKPTLKDETKFGFTLDYDKAKFAELALYDNLLFEVNSDISGFSENLFSVVWEKIELERSSIKNNYNVTLSRQDTSVTVVAYPVLEKEAYSKALATYNTQLEKKENQQKQRNLNSTERNRSALTSNAVRANAVFQNYSATRTYMVPSFGYYNCDQIIPTPEMITSAAIGASTLLVAGFDEVKTRVTHKQIRVNIRDKNGKPLKYKEIYYADAVNNALFRAKANSSFAVKKGSEIALWAITEDGRIAIVEPKMFTEQIQKSNNCVFDAPVVDRISGVAMLRKLLGNV